MLGLFEAMLNWWDSEWYLSEYMYDALYLMGTGGGGYCWIRLYCGIVQLTGIYRVTNQIQSALRFENYLTDKQTCKLTKINAFETLALVLFRLPCFLEIWTTFFL